MRKLLLRSLPRIEYPQRRLRISLTPLIDVVFILLVFFMLASSFLDWRAIPLDAPALSVARASEEGALRVELHAPDELRFAGEVITLEQLEHRLRERLEQRPEQRVLVQAAGGVPLQRTVSVLDRIAASGVSDVALGRGHAP